MLRPTSAVVISCAAWLLAVVLLADAIWKIGLGALWRYGPFLGLGSALVWLILWNPRVLVREHEVEIRNVVHTYTAHFAAVTKVRIGAMVRVDARTARGRERTVTAWNAPGVGRDKPADVLTRNAHSRGRAMPGRAVPHRLGPGARLALDQKQSPSWVLFERWERWHDARERSAIPDGVDDSLLTTRVNWFPLSVVAAFVLLTVLRVAL